MKLDEAIVIKNKTEILEESAIRAARNVLQGKRIVVTSYDNGRGGLIAVAKTGNTYSIFHVENNRVISDIKDVSSDNVEDYLEQHPGYKKVRDVGNILKYGAIIAGVGIGVATGNIALAAMQGIMGAKAISTDLKNVPADIENQKEVEKYIQARIDEAIKERRGEIMVNGSAMADESDGWSIVGIGTTLGSYLGKGVGFVIERILGILWHGGSGIIKGIMQGV